jgi:hypothetical protein
LAASFVLYVEKHDLKNWSQQRTSSKKKEGCGNQKATLSAILEAMSFPW